MLADACADASARCWSANDVRTSNSRFAFLVMAVSLGKLAGVVAIRPPMSFCSYHTESGVDDAYVFIWQNNLVGKYSNTHARNVHIRICHFASFHHRWRRHNYHVNANSIIRHHIAVHRNRVTIHLTLSHCCRRRRWQCLAWQ